jgi:hypothetical protein
LGSAFGINYPFSRIMHGSAHGLGTYGWAVHMVLVLNFGRMQEFVGFMHRSNTSVQLCVGSTRVAVSGWHLCPLTPLLYGMADVHYNADLACLPTIICYSI